MTQNRHRHKRRTFPCPQGMWDAFKELHGEGQAAARLRTLVALDLEVHGIPGFTLDDPDTTTAPGTGPGAVSRRTALAAEQTRGE